MKIKSTVVNLAKNALLGAGIAVLIVSIFSLLVPFVPTVVDFLAGETIIKSHTENIIGNDTNAISVASKLMLWEKEVASGYGKGPIAGFLTWGLYYNNGFSFFVRSDYPSWFILTKIGNCLEHTNYFSKIMNQLGYKSKIILARGEDHAIAEFYDGNKVYFVDPSGNTFIDDPYKFGEERFWSYVQSIDQNGAITDLTSEFIKNRSTLSIKQESPSPFMSTTSISVYSTFLMKHQPNIYKQHNEVLTQLTTDSNLFTIELGAKPDYEITKRVSYYIVSFEQTTPLDLTKNQDLNFNPSEILKLENITLTEFGLIIIALTIIIGEIFFFYQFHKKKKTTSQ